jgi:nucleotide-binding universal stress UspA family protein
LRVIPVESTGIAVDADQRDRASVCRQCEQTVGIPRTGREVHGDEIAAGSRGLFGECGTRGGACTENGKAVQGMKLIVLNVQEQLERWYQHGLASETSREHLKEQGQAQSAAARKLLDESGCSYEFMIMFGQPAETIVQVAREHGCSGIVMGTRGLGDLENVFLGSTSFKVVHLSEVPMTLVK